MVVAGCFRPVTPARTAITDAPSAAEIDAADRVRNQHCRSSLWGAFFPGVAQLCLGQTGEGITLAGLTVAEVTTAITVGVSQEEGLEHPGSALPAVGAQDLWVYSLSAGAITRQLASQSMYTPTASLTDLVAAPFNLEVLAEPEVWAGMLAGLGIGIGASVLISDLDSDNVGDDPDVFGTEVDPAVGYPIAAGVGVALFTHVAVAEEALFRGLLQSSFARNYGELTGWAAATTLFGLAHVPNALALEGDERRDYLIYGIPIITALGGYMGWIYQRNGYTLEHPVAVHFWYDLLLSAVVFALDPQDSPISVTIKLPL